MKVGKTYAFCVLATAVGTMLYSGCNKSSDNSSVPATAQNPPAKTSSVDDPTQMTVEQIAAANAEIDKRVADLQATSSGLEEKQLSRLEGELKALETQALSEGNPTQAIEDVNNLKTVMRQGSSVLLNLLRSDRVTWTLPSSRALIDSTIIDIESWPHEAQAISDSIKSLDDSRPQHLVAQEWEKTGLSEVAQSINARAVALLPTGVSALTEVRSRQGIADLIAGLEGRDKATQATAAAILTDAQSTRAKINDALNRYKAFPDTELTVKAAAATLDSATAAAQRVSMDHTDEFNYQRNLLAKLPNDLSDLQTIQNAEAIIAQARIQTPAFWVRADWSAAYDTWIVAAYSSCYDTLNGKLAPAIDSARTLTNISSEVPDIANRAALADWISTLQHDEKKKSEAANKLLFNLASGRTEAVKLRSVVTAHAELANKVDQTVETIDSLSLALKPLTQTDRSAMYAYHQAFLATLPVQLSDLGSINRMGAAVKNARKNAPSKWDFPLISTGYDKWQSSAFHAILLTGLGPRLDQLRSKYAGRVGSKDGMNAWHTAALAIDAETASRLIEFLNTDVLDASSDSDYIGLVPAIDDTRGEYDIAALPRNALHPLNAYELTRNANLAGAVRAYHIALINKLNRGADLSAIAGLKKEINSASEESPSMWDPKQPLVAMYGKLQREQWRAWGGNVFGATVGAAVAAYPGRLNPDTKQNWGTALRGLGMKSEQADKIVAFLTSDIVELNVFDESAASDPDPMASTGLPLWQDIAVDLDRIENQDHLPAMVNPYPVLRQQNDPAACAYHVALIRRFNHSNSLQAVAAMQSIVRKEMADTPKYWSDPNIKSLYGQLQLLQAVKLVEKISPGGFGNQTGGMSEAYIVFSEGDAVREQWIPIARRYKPDDAHAMVQIMQNGLFDPAFLKQVQTQIGLATGGGDAGQCFCPEFWEAVDQVVENAGKN